MLELIGFGILLFSIFLILTNRPNHFPPGPRALPVIGHLHLLEPLIHHSFRDISSRYGPIIFLRLGSVPCVVASTPELAKELLKTNDLTFSSRQMDSRAITHLTYNSSFAFAPYGPFWKFLKKLSTFELLSSRALSQFHPIRKNELQHLLQHLLNKSKLGESVNVTQELLNLSNNIISRMMLGIRCSGNDSQADDAKTLAREVTQIFGEFNVSDLVWFCRNLDFQGFRKKYEDVHRRFDALLENIITNRELARKKSGGELQAEDLLDMMLDTLEDQNSGVEFTRDTIKALVLYWENPLEFQPERFLKSNGDTVNDTAAVDIRGQHCQLLPFGTGRRSCPGLALAMQELSTTLPAMIQCFEWNLVGPHGEKINGDGAVDMTERPGLTVPRAHDLVCAPVPRQLDIIQHFLIGV
ncbi:unnamed protein product [Dovyalis caffra]|uniref:Flavone synthase II n=1 Tax=Dovyalis caffra TaxID=77055 RepID=A0AAV1RWU4_9ROSI|nr:unnamed protein product [Dovyalis caffra]